MKKGDELTIKQEKYVQNLLLGMSQRQAYIDAYDTESTNPNSLDVEACRTFNDPKVRLRYHQLLEEYKEHLGMTREEKRKMLQEFATDENNSKDIRMKALDLDNKMCGEYVEKKEVSLTSDNFILTFNGQED